ncbi:MAG TPA: hypothetical protein VFR24_10250 [Candidatus Angelobacter sp.]|nr:hypothetical protein [Candidatus Angelobacter sp.]
MPQSQVGRRRLDSWKEIARYLGKHQRTVIRWEKKNHLPVHRVPGGSKQAVFAYADEIDAWLLGEDLDKAISLKDDASTTQSSANRSIVSTSAPSEIQPFPSPAYPTPALEKSDRGFPAWRWNLAALVVGLLIIFAIVRFVLSPLPSGSSRPFKFAQITDDGRYKLNLRTDSHTLYFNEFEVSREVLMSASVAGGPPHEIATPFANIDLQDISNDGRRLLVTSFEGTELQRPLWIFPLDGGAPQRIGNIPCHFARWSPDNTRIACSAGTTIIVMNSDGSTHQVLGPFPGVINDLIWSPKGSKLRFVLQDQHTIRNVAWEIEVGKSETSMQSVPTKLSWGEDCCLGWAWTPDGGNFVYASYDGKSTLYVQSDTSSSENLQTELPINIGSSTAITANRNGDGMYLLISKGSRGQLLKFNSRQKALQAILPGLAADFLSFSRDGQWMTYTTAADFSLWRSRIDGSEAVQLTKPPMEVELSSWSPGGRQIAFMGRQPGKPFRLFLINRDGGTAQKVVEGNDQQGAPTWSADGKFLVYGDVLCQETESCWIRVLNLATRQIEKLPDSHGLRTARWSPDGKYIAAFQPKTHKLMLFDMKKRHWSVLANSVTGDNLNWSFDSKFVYADSPQGEKPIIERIQIANRQRATVMELASLQGLPGQFDFWFGLTSHNEIILYNRYTISEVYKLNWRYR